MLVHLEPREEALPLRVVEPAQERALRERGEALTGVPLR
jgi:hypothetical protein